MKDIMKNKTTIAIILCCISLLVYTNSVLSQERTITSSLIYMKGNYEKTEALIVLTSGNYQSFDTRAYDCYLLSPDNMFIALSNRNGQILIHRVSDGIVVRAITPLNEQSSCSIKWQDNGILGLFDSTQLPSRNPVSVINILSGESVNMQVRSPLLTSADIPNLLPNDFFEISANQAFAVYNYCQDSKSEKSEFSGELVCISGEQLVLYDVNRQEILETFADTDKYTFDLYFRQYLTDVGVGWSPSGQYFSYRIITFRLNIDRQIRIYDAIHRQYMDYPAFGLLDIPLYIDWLNGVIWLEGEEEMAFWLEEPGGVHGKNLAVMQVANGEITLSPGYHEYIGGSHQWAQGIRDGTIVFIDAEKNLMELNVNTGATTLLDTNVFSVEYR